jgi:excisionase family DNA binding protein
MDESCNTVAPADAIPSELDHVERACLTYTELSELTGISQSTLRRRVKQGTIPFLQPGGPRTRVVFPIDVIDRLTQASQPIPQAQPAPEKKTRRLGPEPKWKRQPQL